MLQVNHERVAKLLQGLAAFTDSEEGVTRLAYSPLDKKAQSWLLEQVQDLHLQIRTDAMRLLQRRLVVAVHRPHVVKAHVLEKRGVGEHRALDALFHVVDEGVDRLADQIIQ